MRLLTNTPAGRAIEKRTGRSIRVLEMEPLREEPNAFAFRATFHDLTTRTFQTIGTPLFDITAASLEDVRFTAWPPTSRR